MDNAGGDDVLIGAYGNDQGGADAGKTYLFLADTITAQPLGTSFDLDAHADYAFVGQPGEKSGGAVTSAGNLDGDVYDDILIGIDDSSVLPGTSYVMLGSAILAEASSQE